MNICINSKRNRSLLHWDLLIRTVFHSMDVYLSIVILLMGIDVAISQAVVQSCRDDNGFVRAQGDYWLNVGTQQERYNCSCEVSPMLVPGTAPSVNCRLMGCYDNFNQVYKTEGGTMMKSNGFSCRCVNGTEPTLADEYTLFHWNCSSTECPADISPVTSVACAWSIVTEECPSNSYCNIAPNDMFAVCCPLCPNGLMPASGVTCSLANPSCPANHDCYLDQRDTYASCCPRTPDCGSCITLFDPVCANDSTTYSNVCEMNRAACKAGRPRSLRVMYQGQCQSTCPNGESVWNCFADPCLSARCEVFPPAECRANYCGGCNADFYVDNQLIDCNRDIQYCRGGNGVHRYLTSWLKMGSQRESYNCTCEVGMMPRGTPPGSACRLLGCQDRYTQQYKVEGDIMQRPDGSQCTCIPGNDPFIADTFTYFYWQCPAAQGCSEGTIFNCFADPCRVTSCPAYRDAECRSNYCNGCHAEFYVSNSQIDCGTSGTCTDGGVTYPTGGYWMRSGSNGERYNCTCDVSLTNRPLETIRPAVDCRLIGCQDVSTRQYKSVGQTMVQSDGKTCTCVYRPSGDLDYRWQCPEDDCPSGQIANCESFPCDVESCSLYPRADCRANYCEGCFANFYANGVKINCNSEVIAFCPNSRTPISGFYCGLGGGPCPSGYTCHGRAADGWAVCCPDNDEEEPECEPAIPCGPMTHCETIDPCPAGVPCAPGSGDPPRVGCFPDINPTLKAGVCPNIIGTFGICVEECSGDTSCQGDQKCCSNGCGHICQPPVTSCQGMPCGPPQECEMVQPRCSTISECVTTPIPMCLNPRPDDQCTEANFFQRMSACYTSASGALTGSANQDPQSCINAAEASVSCLERVYADCRNAVIFDVVDKFINVDRMRDAIQFGCRNLRGLQEGMTCLQTRTNTYTACISQAVQNPELTNKGLNDMICGITLASHECTYRVLTDCDSSMEYFDFMARLYPVECRAPPDAAPLATFASVILIIAGAIFAQIL